MPHDTPLRSDSPTALWNRIARHPVGGDGAEAFVSRLAREQGWSRTEALAAILEYRRFCFLAMTAGHEVVPSEEVDAVWHLHLLHTRDYWTRFCPTVLGGALHHSPTGGVDEEPRFRENYALTLSSYERSFGAPALRWWPGSAQRFARKRAMTRVDPGRYWMVPRLRLPQAFRLRLATLLGAALVALPAFAADALPANPLDWSGTPFLMLFVAAMAAALVGSLLLRAFLRRQLAPAPRNIGELSLWEAAWLAGGPLRVVDAGIAELHRLGKVRVDAGGKLEVLDPQYAPEAPLDAILVTARLRGQVSSTLHESVHRLGAIQSSLQRRGLWFDSDTARRISRNSALPWLALVIFGVAKITIGIERERPVTLLVILTVICAVFALGMYFSRSGCTPAGDAELKRLNAHHATTRHAPRNEQIALAVALAGTGVLAGTALASYHDVRQPRSSDSSSGSDSGSGDSGGSSGCGGCGGGGD